MPPVPPVPPILKKKFFLFLFVLSCTFFAYYLFLLQAPDPKKMQDVFESFCHSVVNRGQQIVHKLLGDQFKVC